MGDNTAVLEGYTKEIVGHGIARDIFLLIKPNTDLDGDFRAYDTDKQDFVMVHGYQWNFGLAE